MARFADLTKNYERYIHATWPRNQAGAQRVVMVLYGKDQERALRGHLQEFEHRTTTPGSGGGQGDGHGWVPFDCTDRFARWMAAEDYAEAYFEEPELLQTRLDTDFRDHLAEQLIATLEQATPDDVVAVFGVASLFGFANLSDLIHRVEPHVRGRLVVFFPGSRDGDNYRLLDAYDGWNYLAVPITSDLQA